ncbi:MAG: extracellular solute-binding protein [Bacteroidales bacterium]|jgi:molybdate/tungstate transport system substrate-binding protein|nr:extracellular solute-binding protein [Bacteroidales bacterium]
MRLTLIFMLAFLLILSGCGGGSGEKKLIIFHAGSLSVPVKKLSEAFMEDNPGVRVLTEAAGSLHTARKITELGKPCDIMLSADHFVVSSMLIPDYASWNIRFATNEIVVAFRPESKYSPIFREDNWADILLRDDVIMGRADPDADPCGYRTVFAAKLAEDYYERPGLADSLLGKDTEYIRPKEVDLVALVSSGVIDYMFQYKSVAIQHGFSYLELPDEINLSSPLLTEHYTGVSYMIPGEAPGIRTEVRGDYISYSGTVPDRAPQKELALRFFEFMLSEEGRQIFRDCGQDPLMPAVADDLSAAPERLKKYLAAGTQ